MIRAGQLHRPGHAARRAPEFTVDEITYPACQQAERYQRCDKIRQRKERPADAPSVPPHADQNTEKPAMERHAALPHPEDLHRVGQPAFEIVEKDVTQPPPENHAQRGIEKQVVHLRR